MFLYTGLRIFFCLYKNEIVEEKSDLFIDITVDTSLLKFLIPNLMSLAFLRGHVGSKRVTIEYLGLFIFL